MTSEQTNRPLTSCEAWCSGAIMLAIVAVMVLILGSLGHALDRNDEQASAATVDAQKHAQRMYRLGMAAAALCREQHGDPSHTFTAADQLVCTPNEKAASAQVDIAQEAMKGVAK